MGGSVDVAESLLKLRTEIEREIFTRVLEVAPRGGGYSDHEYGAELRVAVTAAVDFAFAAAKEHGCELEQAARSPGRRRLELVLALLAGASSPGNGAELGYDFDGWHLGTIATGIEAAQALGALRVGTGCRMLSVARGEQTVWAWFASGRRRVAGVELERLFQAARSERVSLAIGEPGWGLAGWRATHQQAQAALLVMLRRPRAVTRYADVALLAAALKDEALGRALIDIYLSPLEGSRDGGLALREALYAYFAAGRNVSSTASTLGVARSTVESRLRAIEERLGRTLSLCSAELEVALQLDALAG